MVGILKGLGWFILYVLLMALSQQMLMMVGSGESTLQAMSLYMTDHMLGIAAVSNLLVGLALILLFCFRKKGIKAEWHLLPFKKKDLMYAVILAFSYSLFASLLTRNQSSVVGGMFGKSTDYYGALLGSVLKIINLLLLAPMVEEIVLRGIVYTRIAEHSPAWATILINGILFGLMHFMAGGTVLVVNATIMGIILGFLLYRYDSLWICIVAHIAANLPEFLLLNAHKYPTSFIWILEAVSIGAAGYSLIKIVRN